MTTKNNHKDIHALNEPWAITQDALETIAHQLKHGKMESLEAGIYSDDTGGVELDVRNGVAVIEVIGGLWRYDYANLRRKVEAALGSPAVRAMVMQFRSPGGLVSGCKETADFIFKAGKQKHIYAYADGMMCSAAYWIGSAAREIAAPATADIGSIGVRTLHIDWTGWNEQAGLKFTHIAAGRYKTLGNEDEPLGKEAREYFQSRLNATYDIFVDAVAAQRGVDREKALAMADGKVFITAEALELGLIDRVEQDFESYLSTIFKKEKIMDLTTLKNDHPELYGQVIEKGKADASAANQQALDDAVAEESTRMIGLAAAVVGEETAGKLKELAAAGVTPEMAESMKNILGAQDTKDTPDDAAASTQNEILAALQQAHSGGVNPGSGAQKSKSGSVEDQASEFASLVNN